MNRKTILKLLLDIVMVILYLLLMFARFAGNFFHEAAGIGIGILFLMHLFLNASMIRGLFQSVKSGHAKPERIILFISDIVLTISMPIVIITGIFIARELFVIDIGFPIKVLFNIHNLLSYLCLCIIILHILLHAKYLLGVIKKLPGSFKGKEMRSALCLFSAGVIAAGMLYLILAMYKNADDRHLVTDSHTETTNPDEDENESSDDEDQTNPSDGSHESANEETTVPPPALKEYLSRLRCNGCGRGCFLLTPRCSEGRYQAKEAEIEYYRIHHITNP